jgi:DNA polymerase III delta subunit
MIILLHGDDTANSRKAYGELKKTYPNSVTFEGDAVTLTDLTQELSGGGLFSEEKHVFLEQLLSKKKAAAEREAIIALLTSSGKESVIVLWESKEIDKKTLSFFPQAQNRVFKLPQTLFALLDAMKPRNTTTLIDLFHKTIEATEEELAFFMLVRQVRLLLALSNPQATIDETKRMTPWQRGKLQKQATYFSKEQLILLYKKLFEIEKGMKTGTLSMSLSSTIDIFLTEV